jgi:hypothetical protein
MDDLRDRVRRSHPAEAERLAYHMQDNACDKLREGRAVSELHGT